MYRCFKICFVLCICLLSLRLKGCGSSGSSNTANGSGDDAFPGGGPAIEIPGIIPDWLLPGGGGSDPNPDPIPVGWAGAYNYAGTRFPTTGTGTPMISTSPTPSNIVLPAAAGSFNITRCGHKTELKITGKPTVSKEGSAILRYINTVGGGSGDERIYKMEHKCWKITGTGTKRKVVADNATRYYKMKLTLGGSASAQRAIIKRSAPATTATSAGTLSATIDALSRPHP